MSDIQLKRANQKFSDAKKALTAFFPIGKAAKAEKASDLFKEAANGFKAALAFDKAAEAYSEATGCYETIESPIDAADSAINAAKCYRKVDPNSPQAVTFMKRAIDNYKQAGKANNAAKTLSELGDILAEKNDVDGAVEAYDQAAELYSVEDNKSLATAQKQNIGKLYLRTSKYQEACKLFENIATSMCGNRLTEYGASEYFMKGALCGLANDDPVACQQVLDAGLTYSGTFENSREYELCKAIRQAYDDKDQDALSQASMDYDQIKKLEPALVDLLLHIKEMLSGEDDLL